LDERAFCAFKPNGKRIFKRLTTAQGSEEFREIGPFIRLAKIFLMPSVDPVMGILCRKNCIENTYPGSISHGMILARPGA